jgi:Spy/CpxP family protein refolding chaperone
MNSFNLMLRVTGAIAALAIAVTPIAAFAQPQQTQESEPPIVLTQEQQAEFKRIQEKTIADIEGVLTEEQQAQFVTGMENGQGFRAVQDLSETQKTRILAILQAFDIQIGNLLTTEQKQKIQEYQMRNQQN